MKLFDNWKILVFVAALGAVVPVSTAEEVIEGTNFCSKREGCECTILVTPRPLYCQGMQLKLIYEQNDFLATIEALNITSNTTLDVRFDENQITEIPRFPPYPIVVLSLRHNRISFIETSAFAELKQLQYLDLSHNNLTSASLNEGAFTGSWNNTIGYFPLASLKHLNISHNRIHSLDKGAFDHLTQLKTIDLSHNPLKVLSGTTSMAISSLRNLEFLSLAHTGVSEMHEGMIHDLLTLTSLDLSGNFFVKVPEELRATHGLTVLSLDRNRFEILDQESFMGLEKLEDLSLRHNEKLKSVETGTFGSLINLGKLDLSFCKRLEALSDGAFKGIVDEHNISDWKLKDIRLNDNGISQIDEALCPWDQVDYIDIQNNPFRCDCNLEWMLKYLMPRINKIKPSLTSGVSCAQPKTMRGKQLVDLMSESDLFSRCRDSKDELFPEEISIIQSGSYRAAGITILIIGVLLCVFGVSIVIFLVVKRRAIAKALVAHQEIRYERADSDDDGIGGIHSSSEKNRRNNVF